MPKALADRPTMPDHLYHDVSAYRLLSRSRNAAGNIPVSEILTYAKFFDVDDPERFLEIVYAVDAGVRAHGSEKINHR